VAAFNLAEGSYLLAQAARVYPPGTVFAADVDPDAGEDERSIVLLTEDSKLFVGPDSGLFTDVMNYLGINSVWEITNHSLPGQESASANFKGIGIRGPVASHLAAGSIPLSWARDLRPGQNRSRGGGDRRQSPHGDRRPRRPLGKPYHQNPSGTDR